MGEEEESPGRDKLTHVGQVKGQQVPFVLQFLLICFVNISLASGFGRLSRLMLSSYEFMY